MTITGAGNIFDALTSDFIFAIRNPGGKSAKYFRNNTYNCEKHAKNSKKYQLPKKEHSAASLKKMKMDQLREFRQRTLGILGISQECPTKKDEIGMLSVFLLAVC